MVCLNEVQNVSFKKFCYHHSQFIRLATDKIIILPTFNILNPSIGCYMQLILKFTSYEISIILDRRMRDEIVISIDQISSFRIKDRDVHIEFVDNLKPLFYRYPDGFFAKNVQRITKDPINGKLNGATSLIITTNDGVSYSTLVMFEEGIKLMMFGRNCDHKALLSKTPNQRIDNSTNKSSLITREKSVKSHNIKVVCKFNDKNIIVNISSNITFEQFYKMLKERNFLSTKLQATCKNNFGQEIMLFDEEDWKVAKWEYKNSGRNQMMLQWF